MKKFICPIDSRIEIPIDDLVNDIPHCVTPLPNSECPYIQKGCFGCRTDKENFFNLQKSIETQLKKFKPTK